MTKVTWEDASNSTGMLREWAYNTGDVMGTLEICEALLPRLGPEQARTYAFHRGLQAPAMDMMLRGVLVDEPKRKTRVTELRRELKKIARDIDERLWETWDGVTLETGLCDKNEGKRHKWPRGVPDSPERKCERCGVSRMKRDPFLPSSVKQKRHLFYDLWGLPPIYNKERKISVDEEAVHKIGRKRPDLQPITDRIMAYMGTQKQIGWLSARLTPDGRYPSSFNVAAAWTSRFSSSKNPYREGGNLQNVAEKNRDVFIADPGYWFFYADIEQAESNIVAHLSGDENYIAAHRDGDPHTFVARLIWPDLAWTGDLEHDKEIAKGTLMDWDKAPGHDIRFQSKRIQHGGNYGLSPPGIALIAHIPQHAAFTMYRRYMGNFPGIGQWQRNTKRAIVAHEALISPLGHRIKLFGRPDDGHTYKQGLSFKPQSTVAHLINIALWRVYNEMQGEAMLLAQVHDALLGMVKVGDYAALKKLKELMTIPLDITDIHGKTRRCTLGVEIAVGCNWGKKGPSNLEGIKTWKGELS